MDEEVKNREGQAGGLDDLLDEILQKNMEEEVHKGDEPAPVRRTEPTAEAVDDGISKKAAVKALEDDSQAGEAAPEEKEKAASDEDDDYATKPTPEEYLDDVFGDEAKPKKKDDEDIRVIEVEVGSEDDTRITKKDILSMLLYVVVIFLLTFVIVHYVGQRTRVSGSSMENTLSNGDNLIVDKLSYRFHDPERFDVIIFPFQYETDTYYIKRIIGLPGETVQIGTDGTIYINGEILDEDYGLETIQDPGMAIDPIVLGEDEYFVLGDNRNNSSDSRFGGVGKVKRDIIIGRAMIRIYPFDEIKML